VQLTSKKSDCICVWQTLILWRLCDNDGFIKMQLDIFLLTNMNY